MDETRKCGLTLSGNVQNQGFRSIVKRTASEHNLNGIVFNNDDGTVTIYCGDNSEIKDFLRDLKTNGRDVGVEYDISEKIDFPSKVRLPRGFYIIDTDTSDDKERKFDKGMEHVRIIKDNLLIIRDGISSIRQDISVLPDMRNDISDMRDDTSSMRDDMSSMRNDMSSIKQDISVLPEIKKILEKISEKL